MLFIIDIKYINNSNGPNLICILLLMNRIFNFLKHYII